MPESNRNSHVLGDRADIDPAEPTMKTMSQENAKTMIVRIAVATVESIVRMPHLARIDVKPEKKAEPTANAIHINAPFHTPHLAR